MAEPVRVSPVKETSGTSGWAASASPAESGPKPWTTLNTPAGRPASWAICASFHAPMGVNSAGLSTQVLPKASAGPIFQVSSISGTFQGVISPATPTGS